jgi:asparagine synthase (glutamine-hydrolysing)
VCGIVGLGDKQLIKKMCDVIYHRGPDDSGYFVDDNISLGNRRLSIIDVAGGHQPIHNEDESIWIVFNGEIYNFLELKKELEEKGHRFYTNCDTETIVHSYEEYGEGCLKKLMGMFSFAIWDKKRKELFLARDRFGKKPLYYTIVDKKLIFGSEIKSILQYDEVKRDLNFKALHNFLTLQYVPGPDTMIRNIKKLPQGHSLSYHNGRLKISKYWDINTKTDEKIDERYAAIKILELFKESVKLRLMSEVPLGVYLSGGLDSSAIVGVMANLANEPVKTFTIGFDHPADELKYARIVAEKFQTNHHELIVGAKSVETLPKIVWHSEEPIADPTTVPTYLLSEMTKKDATVILVGEGGDEIFAYPKYGIAMKLLKYRWIVPNFVKSFVGSEFSSAAINRIPYFKSKKYFELLNEFAPVWNDEARTYMKICTQGFDENDKRKLYTDWMNAKTKNEDTAKVFRKYFNRRIGLFQKIATFGMKVDMSDSLLMKVDKMTMAFSIEARAPFLHHPLVEFTNQLPDKFRKGKYIFKKAMSSILPREILHRKKHAFEVPLRTWFDNNDVKDFSMQILDGLYKKEYFKHEYIVQHILNNSRRAMHEHQIWNLINFEIWHKIFIDEDNIEKPNLSVDKLLE